MCEGHDCSLKLNMRPMGHIAHLRKQFKSINTYDYIIMLIKRRKKIHVMITYCFFNWILTPGCFVPKLVEIGSVVLEKRFFFISSMYFRQFCNNLPLEIGWVLHLNKLGSPSPKDALWQVWLKLAQWFWRRRFFNLINVFFAIS